MTGVAGIQLQSIESHHRQRPASSREEVRVVHGHTQPHDDSAAWLSRRSESAVVGGDGGALMRMNQYTTAKLAQADVAATTITFVTVRGGAPAMAPDSSDMPPQFCQCAAISHAIAGSGAPSAASVQSEDVA